MTIARLLFKTVPVDDVEWTKDDTKHVPKTSDDIIPYTARVSNPGNQLNFATAHKLVGYLQDHGHWSPLDMANAVIEVKTTRDISHQMLRHWSARFQEFSQRYAEVTEFSEPVQARLQDKKNRQNSISEDVDPKLIEWWNNTQLFHLEMAKNDYQQALTFGIAKEVARKILPEGLTMTTLYINMSIRSWVTYMFQRRDKSTQLEHRMVANACFEELLKHFPSVFERYR